MADEYIELGVTTDEADLADVAVAKLQLSWDGWQPSDGDLEMVMIELFAAMAADAATTAASVPAEIFSSFGQDLAGVDPQLGGYALTTLRFHLLETVGMTIPEGTEVDVDGYIFETDQDVTSAPTDEALDAAATATEIGSAFNGKTGSSVSMVSSVAGIDSVEVLSTSSGGFDPETDADYLNRLSQAMELRGITLVTERDYELMALTETGGVGKVVATHLGARHVRVVGMDAEGLDLSAPTKARLQELYAAYRMVNTTVEIENPTRTEVNVTYAVKAYSGHDLASLEADIDSRLASFLSPATWGESPDTGTTSAGARWYNEPRVRVNKLIDEIGDSPGVDYVDSITLSATSPTPVDFEDEFDLAAAGETVWLNKQTAPGALTYVTTPVVASQAYSMRNRLEPGMDDPATGDQRSELIGHHVAAEGVEKWFRLAVRIEQWSILATKWGLIWQQHLGAGSPPLALYMREAAPLQFRLANGITDENHWLKPISEDTWYELVIGVKWSTSATTGWVEVWLDGVQQTLETGGGAGSTATRRVARTATTSAGDYAVQNYDKLGLYTADLNVGMVRDVYHGRYRVGPSFNSVMDVPDSTITPESNGDLILPGDVPLPEPGTFIGTVT